uniref:Myb-like domain-containing protein n=1 Tax=Physcomitrium patens TaxID=3218 RepID=A0A7I4F7K6_PHYPA
MSGGGSQHRAESRHASAEPSSFTARAAIAAVVCWSSDLAIGKDSYRESRIEGDWRGIVRVGAVDWYFRVAIALQIRPKRSIWAEKICGVTFLAMDGDRSQTPVSLPPPMKMLSTTSLQSSETEKKPSVARNGDEKREEWSARSVALFLDLYEEKYFEMDRGSFRSKDWEQLVDRFNMEGGGGKSVKQCRDKMDSLKKRHKLEKGRKASTGAETCSWVWFQKMDGMFGDHPKHQSVLLGPPDAVDMKFPADKFRITGGENVVIEEEESRRLVGSWREAKKILQELPLSAEERGKARTLLLEKKEEERLEYFEGDFEEVSHCLKLLVERASGHPTGMAGLVQMDFATASDIQRRLEEVLTDGRHQICGISCLQLKIVEAEEILYLKQTLCFILRTRLRDLILQLVSGNLAFRQLCSEGIYQVKFGRLAESDGTMSARSFKRILRISLLKHNPKPDLYNTTGSTVFSLYDVPLRIRFLQ